MNKSYWAAGAARLLRKEFLNWNYETVKKLINLYLRDCVQSKRKISLKWAS
jgi:hypothetical protein